MFISWINVQKFQKLKMQLKITEFMHDIPFRLGQPDDTWNKYLEKKTHLISRSSLILLLPCML